MARRIIILDHLDLLSRPTKLRRFIGDLREVLIGVGLRVVRDVIVLSLVKIHRGIVLQEIVLELSGILLFSQVLRVIF